MTTPSKPMKPKLKRKKKQPENIIKLINKNIKYVDLFARRSKNTIFFYRNGSRERVFDHPYHKGISVQRVVWKIHDNFGEGKPCPWEFMRMADEIMTKCWNEHVNEVYSNALIPP